MIDRHPILDDLLDRRLTGEERRAAELHLSGCDRCRAEWQQLSAMRELLRRTADDQDVPQEVRQRVEAALRPARNRAPRLRWLAAAAAIAAAAVLAVTMIMLRKPDQPREAARDYRSVAAAPATLEMRTSNAAELETWFAEHLPFKPGVYDFAMMDFELLGGRVEDVSGAPTSLAVYRHKSGRIVVCEMYEGSAEDLPPPVERREHNGIEFLVYEEDGVQLVFWQEGSVVCVLSGELPRDELLSLAFAKAKRV